jgi:hypothetical protein
LRNLRISAKLFFKGQFRQLEYLISATLEIIFLPSENSILIGFIIVLCCRNRIALELNPKFFWLNEVLFFQWYYSKKKFDQCLMRKWLI